MSVASTLSPTEWVQKWYGDGGFAKAVATTLTDWNVGGKSNNIYNRLMTESILNVLLVRITNTGDMEYNPDITIAVLTDNPMMRSISRFVVKLFDSNKEEVERAEVDFNPHTGKWLVMDGLIPCN